MTFEQIILNRLQKHSGMLCSSGAIEELKIVQSVIQWLPGTPLHVCWLSFLVAITLPSCLRLTVSVIN